MDLCSVAPQLNLYDKDWPIYTLWHADPPAKTVFSEAGDGPPRRGARFAAVPGRRRVGREGAAFDAEQPRLCRRTRQLEDCVLLRGVKVGKRCNLPRVILDKWNRCPTAP